MKITLGIMLASVNGEIDRLTEVRLALRKAMRDVPVENALPVADETKPFIVKRERKPLSAAARRRIGAAQKKRWAKLKKAA